MASAQPVWAWQDDDGRWNDYDAKDSLAIEEAVLAGKPKLGLRMAGTAYTLDLVGLKQTNDRTKRSRPIKQVQAGKPKMPSKAIETLFEKCKEAGVREGADKEADSLQGHAFIVLCEELGIDVEDPVLLTIAWKGKAALPFQVTRDEWARAMGTIGVDSKDKLKAALPKLRTELKTDQRAFKDFYSYVFDFVKETPQAKVLPNDVAVSYWKMLLADRRWQHLDAWCHFIGEKYKKAITKDTWRQLLDFMQSDLEAYDADGAWPLTMDDFVEWFKASK